MECFKSFVATSEGFTFKIEENLPDVGFYLYVFKNGKCIRDDDQDTLQACKEVALEMYGVPMDAWREEGKYFESLVATNNKGDTFRIKGDLPGVGFYLHAFDKEGENIDDDLGGFGDLQDTIQVCKEVALKKFGVPMDAWREE